MEIKGEINFITNTREPMRLLMLFHISYLKSVLVLIKKKTLFK